MRTAQNTVTVERTEMMDLGAMTQKMDELAASAVTDTNAIRRSLPDVAAHVLELCQLTCTDAGRVEKEVTRDPFISGQLVAVANSAMFAPRMPIIGVRDAVVRLGLDNVCDIVMMVVNGSTMFRVPGFESHVDLLRKRGLAAAIACRTMAKVFRFAAENAFLAGLMHDIGELVLLERCAKVGGITPAMLEDLHFGPVIKAAIRRLHTELGGAVCGIWKMPASVVDAAAYHHNCKRNDNRHLTTALAAAADVICDHLGLGNGSPGELPYEHTAFADLKLSPDQINQVVTETQKSLPTLSGGH
jgi:HD-like signal output (HDOD) protein